MAENVEKPKMGAPTKYREHFCDTVIELMSEGASKAEVCLELMCDFNSFLNWQKEYPDFLQAVKRGTSLSKGKWEQMGRKAAFGDLDGFNATSWIFNMKNRFGKIDELGERWSDKQEVDHSGGIALTDMGDEELDSRIKMLLKND
jgi:hypothetical protein